MKHFLLTGIFFLVLKVVQSQNSRHVILLSIDGLRPEFYLDSTWPAPNLQNLASEGVKATAMKSVFPSYTYPSHVAMITGALPARSGIYHNVPLGSKGDWNWFMSEIKVPTIWQAMKKLGLTTASVQWPVSVGEEITFNISEIWDPSAPFDRITVSRTVSTRGLIEEVEKNATGRLQSSNMHEEFMGLDDNSARAAAYIFEKYQPNLLAVHFAGVDGKQHKYGRDHFEVKLALSNIDHAIGWVREAVERSSKRDSTTIIVVGDHGFCNIESVLKPNKWIKDIRAKFQAAGGSAFLYPDVPGNLLIADSVERILRELPHNYRSRFRVLNRKMLDTMGVDSSAALALSASPGVVFSNSTDGEQLSPASGGHHGYDPALAQIKTGFIAFGNGIKRKSDVSELSVVDISPLIAALLGIEFKVPDGVLVPGIMQQ